MGLLLDLISDYDQKSSQMKYFFDYDNEKLLIIMFFNFKWSDFILNIPVPTRIH